MSDFLLLFAGCIGMMTTSILFLFYRTNFLINLYLLIILFYISVYGLLKSSYSLGIQTFVDHTILGYKQLSAFVFPLLFLFINTVLETRPNHKNKYWFHFILPFLFFSSFQALNFFGTISNTLIIYFYILYFIFNSGYLLASIALFKTYTGLHSIWVILQDKNHQKEQWILFVLIVWTLLCVRVGVLVIMDVANGMPTGFDSGIGLWAILVIAIFVKLLLSPELLYGHDFLDKRIKTNAGQTKNHTVDLDIWKLEKVTHFSNQQDQMLASKVSENLIEHIQKIESLLLSERKFRSKDFDLNVLSKQMNIPRSHLTFLFKYHCKLFFPDFKKMLQIKDAKELIESGYLTENTFESLSSKVGFSSYNPFFIAFKKYTGQSPNNYINK